MRCIWQMDGDKVKGFKCDFSPIEMLSVCSGLRYIVADAERHPKDREIAQHIYNKIMLARYEDEAEDDEYKWPAPPHHAPKGEMETCVTYSAYTLEKLGLIDTEAKKKCHKPQSAYYRCYCDELEEEEYCNGCEFWYAEQKGE